VSAWKFSEIARIVFINTQLPERLFRVDVEEWGYLVGDCYEMLNIFVIVA
jgi:hypothetical protein